MEFISQLSLVCTLQTVQFTTLLDRYKLFVSMPLISELSVVIEVTFHFSFLFWARR